MAALAKELVPESSSCLGTHTESLSSERQTEGGGAKGESGGAGFFGMLAKEGGGCCGLVLMRVYGLGVWGLQLQLA